MFARCFDGCGNVGKMLHMCEQKAEHLLHYEVNYSWSSGSMNVPMRA